MSPIDKLTQLFERFPGIGPRQARRFVQYLLSAPPGARADLARHINALGASTAQCQRCFRWFAKDGPSQTKDRPLCPICGDSHRDASLLFVVEKDADLDQVERSGYKGLYFVLGGTVPLAAEEPAEHVRLRELLDHIENDSGDASIVLKEVILGLSATSEGDHTRGILIEALKPLGVTLTSLGRGLSTGSELEYADPDTIASALSSRH